MILKNHDIPPSLVTTASASKDLKPNLENKI